MNKKAKNFELSEKAKLIKKLRKQKGWNQIELAKKANISRGTIQNIETGRHDQLDKILSRVLIALGKEEENINPGSRQDIQKEDTRMDDLLNMVKMILGQPEENLYRIALTMNIRAFFHAIASESGKERKLGPLSAGSGGTG